MELLPTVVLPPPPISNLPTTALAKINPLPYPKMQDPKSSRSASDVFSHNLYRGTMDGKDKGLLAHLQILRKEASKDGDTVFSLPDNSKIWVHFPLFYIASGEKLPSDFGVARRLDTNSDAVETISNSLGAVVTVLFVTEENQPTLKNVVDSCYTANNLDGLWKAMGYPSNAEGLEGSVPQNLTLPTSVLPDFEIQLKDLKDKHLLFSVKVHKFLLARRIPYYETFFASGFGDASAMKSILYTEEFTIFSLYAVMNFVYHQNPLSVFEGYPTLRDYTTPSPTSLTKVPSCASFDKKLSIPALEIADKLLEIAKSAHYLQATDLQNWSLFFLCESGHQFRCQGRGCIEFVPHIMNLVLDNDIIDDWIFRKGISFLAQHKSILTMWKRPLLNCKPSVLKALVREVQTHSETEEQKGRILQLFTELSNLRRHTSTSKNSKNWDKKLIVPLMDHTAGVIAENFDNPGITNGVACFFHGMNFSRAVGEELLEIIVDNKTIAEKNCRQIFVGIVILQNECGRDIPEIENAKMKCIAWFERKWVTLSLTPAPISPKTSFPKNQQSAFAIETPALPSQRNKPHISSKGRNRAIPSRAVAANEGNFFSTWEISEVEDLAKDLPASVSDLLATSHRSKAQAIDNRFNPLRRAKPGASSAVIRGGSSSQVSATVSDTGAD